MNTVVEVLRQPRADHSVGLDGEAATISARSSRGLARRPPIAESPEPQKCPPHRGVTLNGEDCASAYTSPANLSTKFAKKQSAAANNLVDSHSSTCLP